MKELKEKYRSKLETVYKFCIYRYQKLSYSPVIYLTNLTQEVMPIKQLDNRTLHEAQQIWRYLKWFQT